MGQPNAVGVLAGPKKSLSQRRRGLLMYHYNAAKHYCSYIYYKLNTVFALSKYTSKPSFNKFIALVTMSKNLYVVSRNCL